MKPLDARQQRLLAAIVTIVLGATAAYFVLVPFSRPVFVVGDTATARSQTCWPALVSAWRSEPGLPSGSTPLASAFVVGSCRAEARHRLEVGGLAAAVSFVAGYGFWRPRRPPWPRRRRIRPV